MVTEIEANISLLVLINLSKHPNTASSHTLSQLQFFSSTQKNKKTKKQTNKHHTYTSSPLSLPSYLLPSFLPFSLPPFPITKKPKKKTKKKTPSLPKNKFPTTNFLHPLCYFPFLYLYTRVSLFRCKIALSLREKSIMLNIEIIYTTIYLER